MIRRFLLGSAIGLVLLALLMGGLWIFARDASLRWLLNSPVAVLLTRGDQADTVKDNCATRERRPKSARRDGSFEAGGAFEAGDAGPFSIHRPAGSTPPANRDLI